MRIAPIARATRCVAGLFPTSTIWACPELSKWLNLLERFILSPSSTAQIGVLRVDQSGASREPEADSVIILSMRIPLVCLGLALLVPQAKAQALPELGDTSGALLSPYLERKIGEQAMQEIRQRDQRFLDDPELTEYVNEIGRRIVAASPEARQDFEFFLVRDNTINAFAMPGGFVGVHTGLLLAAQTESELAGVLAHEVAHVTQHHIARLLGKQEQMSIPMLAAVVLGLLAARSNPDLTQAVIAGAGATSIQSQLNYTRDFEREADRIGFQFLQQAGFDVGGMGSFFERMQKSTRLYENNAPAYLRTHPLTSERIADMQNRAQTAAYKQAPDSIEFSLARAKLSAEQGPPREAVAHFGELVREHRYANEAGARYGLASARARAREFSAAAIEVETVRKLVGTHPMVELLAARSRGARGVARRSSAGSQLSAASLRLCGGAAGIGTAPGRARLARGTGKKLPPRCPTVWHAGQILRCIRQTTSAPSGACRKLCSTGYPAGGNRAAAARAEKRGR